MSFVILVILIISLGLIFKFSRLLSYDMIRVFYFLKKYGGKLENVNNSYRRSRLGECHNATAEDEYNKDFGLTLKVKLEVIDYYIIT